MEDTDRTDKTTATIQTTAKIVVRVTTTGTDRTDKTDRTSPMIVVRDMTTETEIQVVPPILVLECVLEMTASTHLIDFASDSLIGTC